MMRSGQLTTTVLGLALLFPCTVRPLETGYVYTDKCVDEKELHEDLKCGYLFAGYTHMRVIKHLFGEPYDMPMHTAAGTISNVNDLVKSQVATLIALGETRVGAMWALVLFTSFITGFYQTSRNTPQGGRLLVFDTLVYVLGKLHDDLARCRKGNTFDSYDSIIESGRAYGGLHVFKQVLLRRHTDKAWDQLRRNDIIGDCVLREELEIGLRPKPLLMNNLGMFRELKEDLQNRYNLSVQWESTSIVMLMAWQRARYLNWKKTNLLHVKSYYKSCFDFLKIVMFRLTIKHMTYLQYYTTDDVDAYVCYVQEWYDIVTEFGTVLSLSEDLHVKSLLNCLSNLIEGIEKIDSVVSYVVVILVTLCMQFGCGAVDPFTIDNREFTIPYRSLAEEQIEALQITSSPVWIEYYSLENAKSFVCHLKLAFRYVNFTAIQSLTEYINEINQTKYVERSENPADESEHLINMSDFE